MGFAAAATSMRLQVVPLSRQDVTKPPKMTLTLISVLAIVLYLASGIILMVRLGRGTPTATGRNIVLALAFAAVVLHSLLLYHRLLIPNGINLGFFNAASLISWIAAVLLILSALRKPVENLGIALLPLAAITILLEDMFAARHVLHIYGTWQIQAHILISVVAYSLLTLGMVQAVLLAIQDRHLRNRQPGGFVRALPPLKTMETLLFQMLGAGFILLTLSLITGILFLQDIFAQHLVHKTVLSIVAWIIFAVLLWGRWRFGWRGRTAIRWTLGGFIVLMLAYFGSKMVLELVLGLNA
jgi:ABC-type uncharacterized transport system permease subunit